MRQVSIISLFHIRAQMLFCHSFHNADLVFEFLLLVSKNLDEILFTSSDLQAVKHLLSLQLSWRTKTKEQMSFHSQFVFYSNRDATFKPQTVSTEEEPSFI